MKPLFIAMLILCAVGCKQRPKILYNQHTKLYVMQTTDGYFGKSNAIGTGYIGFDTVLNASIYEAYKFSNKDSCISRYNFFVSKINNEQMQDEKYKAITDSISKIQNDYR